MKTEDPLSPPGDQPDRNKLRRTKQPLPVLGSKPVLRLFLQPGLLPSGRGRGSDKDPCWEDTSSCLTWAHRVIAHQGPFIGAAGWMSESENLGWRAVSCHWGPAGHGARVVDRLRWCPLSPVPRCFLPSGCSAAPDTQSGHSGTPGERRQMSE